MSETTINQRLKFLLGALNMKAPAFARAIGVSETTFRNYIDRDSKPGTEVIEKIANSFESVNIAWLVTGKGEPLPNKPNGAEINSTVSGDQSSVTNIGQSIGGTLNIHGIQTLDNCKAELTIALSEVSVLRSKLEAANTVIEAKNTVIAAKDETINMLRAAYTRPN
jgi:transcriptional regulator with XRE-family HTH domain